VAAVVGTTIALLPPAVVPTGAIVLEAVPWARVVEVKAEDGTLQPLPPVAATPLLLTVPVGTYQIRLAGPSGGDTRELTVQVAEGGMATPTPVTFEVVTPEDYFNRYLAPTPVAPSGGEQAIDNAGEAAGAASVPPTGTPAATPGAPPAGAAVPPPAVPAQGGV
jgi:hypothetical protein